MTPSSTLSTAEQSLVNYSWSLNTQLSYNTYIKKWLEYCEVKTIRPYEATREEGVEFLVYLHVELEEKYPSVAGARSALSAIFPLKEGHTFGEDPTVSRVLRGMFKLRPSLPKHTVIYIYDADTSVYDHITT